VPEFLLGSAMLGHGKSLGEGSVLGEVLSESGQIEMKLGQAVVEFEVRVEERVLRPLSILLDSDLPAVYKSKRALTKATEGMDVARAKHQQSTRHSSHQGGGGGTGNAGGGDDSSSLREEWEEAVTKVEQARVRPPPTTFEHFLALYYSLVPLLQPTGQPHSRDVRHHRSRD
jgi:hypothetical protein